MMNITWKRSGAILLLISMLAGASTTYAQTWGGRSQNDQQQGRGSDDRGQPRERNDGGRPPERAEQPRRDAKLSPDERRALRRQIDEAGRDIYAPRR